MEDFDNYLREIGQEFPVNIKDFNQTFINFLNKTGNENVQLIEG